jgi:hypothetical protein
LVGVLYVVMSRQFILLLYSASVVNFMLGWSLLKLCCMLLISVWWESKIIKMSLT